ncbi:hypothetical protein ACFY3N_17910 [Streptomyces sp. NPDC000348]|uniref:hypothetical protein n=1 Tax=Streptomyces sp. NPDC000348 TaxID=3364538 RepID=UPI0036A61C0B
MPEPATEQKKEIEEVTDELIQKTAEAPEELTSSVAQLTTVLKMAEAPEVPPQEREGVIESAQNIAAALDVINDPRTPAEVREKLIVIVQQMISALDAVSDPSVPAEERAVTILTVQRCTSVLDLVGAPGTPRELREDVANSIDQVYRVLVPDKGSYSAPGESAAKSGISAAQQPRQDAATIGVALETTGRSETSEGNRIGLAETADEASSSVQESSDPTVSDMDREEARKEADEQLARLNEQLKKVILAQGLPDAPLGEAAEVCTNAVFESVSERSLTRGLEKMIPAQWNSEGVKDYWKAKESGSDALDVQAQLRNDTYDNAPFEVTGLVTGLARIVPADKLFGTVGTPGLHCLQSARQLGRQGVEAGTWLQMAEEES